MHSQSSMMYIFFKAPAYSLIVSYLCLQAGNDLPKVQPQADKIEEVVNQFNEFLANSNMKWLGAEWFGLVPFWLI